MNLYLKGQSYTLFSEKIIYNNEYNAKIIDMLIFKLNKEGIIHAKSDTFKFIGFGNGGNIILSFSINILSIYILIIFLLNLFIKKI